MSCNVKHKGCQSGALGAQSYSHIEKELLCSPLHGAIALLHNYGHHLLAPPGPPMSVAAQTPSASRPHLPEEKMHDAAQGRGRSRQVKAKGSFYKDRVSHSTPPHVQTPWDICKTSAYPWLGSQGAQGHGDRWLPGARRVLQQPVPLLSEQTAPLWQCCWDRRAQL